jgi:sulfite exporter TauE/SafE
MRRRIEDRQAMLEQDFIRGAAAGLASALHCGTMCGGIACGANLLLGAKSPSDRNLNLALMQVGRIATYSAIGGVAGLLGGSVLANSPFSNPAVLQWATAVSLLWMGMVLAGVMPRLALIDNGMQAISSRANTFLRPAGQTRYIAPVTMGVVWGLNACPMVYGAAFLASLTQTSVQGATFMLGFGIGTVPAVIASALGLSWLSQRAEGTRWKLFAGLALAASGVAVIYFPQHFANLLCLVQ